MSKTQYKITRHENSQKNETHSQERCQSVGIYLKIIDMMGFSRYLLRQRL